MAFQLRTAMIKAFGGSSASPLGGGVVTIMLITFLELCATGTVIRVDAQRTNVALGIGTFFDVTSVGDFDSDFGPRGAARRNRVPAMAGLFLVGRDAKGGEVVAHSCKTMATDSRRRAGKHRKRETTSGGCGENSGGGDKGGAVLSTRIGVPGQAVVRVRWTERGFKRPPVCGAERGAVAATEHLSVREVKLVAVAAAKQLEQLAKCEAKPLS